MSCMPTAGLYVSENGRGLQTIHAALLIRSIARISIVWLGDYYLAGDNGERYESAVI